MWTHSAVATSTVSMSCQGPYSSRQSRLRMSPAFYIELSTSARAKRKEVPLGAYGGDGVAV